MSRTPAAAALRKMVPMLPGHPLQHDAVAVFRQFCGGRQLNQRDDISALPQSGQPAQYRRGDGNGFFRRHPLQQCRYFGIFQTVFRHIHAFRPAACVQKGFQKVRTFEQGLAESAPFGGGGGEFGQMFDPAVLGGGNVFHSMGGSRLGGG